MQLTPIQKHLLLGTLLGDGCLILNKSEKTARLQVRQQVKHKEFVDWKYSYFQELVSLSPKIDVHNNSWYFRTKSSIHLKQWHDTFYLHKKKIVPTNIKQLLTHPISLAVWFMDDGNGYSHYRGLRISTYGFTQSEQYLLKDCFKTFGIKINVIQDKKGYQVLIPVQSAVQFKHLIEPYIVPCMKYKLATLTP